jgi:folate-binding protein YgfZ
VIADDVAITDRSAGWARFAIEGPRARELLAAAAEGAPPDLLPEACAPIAIAGADALVAAFGWTGEDALQLFVPVPSAGAASDALRSAGARLEAEWGDPASLEVLRIEAGMPRAGSELDEDVLPAEARLLERAVSFTKGCYTGQEVVARMHSRARVGHLLVGISLAAEAPPPPGAALLHAGAKVGAVSSAARSPAAGVIALGFVRAAHAEPRTELSCQGAPARVVELPFVTLRSGAGAGPR